MIASSAVVKSKLACLRAPKAFVFLAQLTSFHTNPTHEQAYSATRIPSTSLNPRTTKESINPSMLIELELEELHEFNVIRLLVARVSPKKRYRFVSLRSRKLAGCKIRGYTNFLALACSPCTWSSQMDVKLRCQNVELLPCKKSTLDEDKEGKFVDSITHRAFADADHAGCQDTRRSTSGSIQLLGDRLVSWRLKAEKCAISSTELNIVLRPIVLCSILWMRSQLTDYGLGFNKNSNVL
ncbi:hypothetical protein Tco_0019786 [Tanacetum coccineum]